MLIKYHQWHCLNDSNADLCRLIKVLFNCGCSVHLHETSVNTVSLFRLCLSNFWYPEIGWFVIHLFPVNSRMRASPSFGQTHLKCCSHLGTIAKCCSKGATPDSNRILKYILQRLQQAKKHWQGGFFPIFAY